jgi:CPA2 family monovalent cation:H+ antiporter-2
MEHSYPLISTIVFSVVFAFLLGFIASRLKLPTIVGYIVAGIFLSPHTPGFIADIEIAKQLAEIGIILLMFEVGLHFSMKDLLNVHKIAVPGAIIQMVSVSIVSSLCANFLGYNLLESIIFGISIAVASTVVMLRQFEQYHLKNTPMAKIAVGWLVIEDIIMIIAMVILPPLVDMIRFQNSINTEIIIETIVIIISKILIFTIAMVTIGKKLLPKFLITIHKSRSRELVSLSVLAIASGFAFIAHAIFGASFALGAFMAGFILNESEIGRKTVDKSLPLRDIFAVLFFISVGLIFNPYIITQEPILVFITTILVIFGKGIIAFVIMKLFKKTTNDSLILSASLAQIGEFSFILTALAMKLNIISQTLYDMVIASAIISILLNPLLFKIALKYKK